MESYLIAECSRHSGEYGNCERCGKPCSPHYKQVWYKKDSAVNGFYAAGFGHVQCLRNLNWKDAPILTLEQFEKLKRDVAISKMEITTNQQPAGQDSEL